MSHKFLRITNTTTGQGKYRTQNTYSGGIDQTLKYKNEEQLNATPSSWHCPGVRLGANSSLGDEGYWVELLTDGIKLKKWNGTSWADLATNFNAAAHSLVGTEYTLRVVQTSGGAFTIYKDGTSVLTYTDASPITTGYLGCSQLQSRCKWDDFSGTFTEGFEDVPAGTVASGSNVGIFYVVTLEAGTAEVIQTGYSIQASTTSLALTGQSANLLRNRKVFATATALTLTGQNLNFLRGYLVPASTTSFTLTGQNVEFPAWMVAQLTAFSATGQSINFKRKLIAKLRPMKVKATGPKTLLKHPRTMVAGPMAVTSAAPEIWFYPRRIHDMSRNNSIKRMSEVELVVDPEGYVIGVVQGGDRISYFPRTDEASASVGKMLWYAGVGSPQDVLAAPVGSVYTRTDGELGNTLYVKEYGGSTSDGWVLK